ncbi:hypothetical protein K437DRAFT_256719 [Tilletiaria anomala UBC 951]|uniref:DUF6533 domain-containing protein n=1 Tax=Tilletiaria anomala (strain ATCC 24038 / CBS 436.72 / UBC 951) TaxID=1037660 RepID=A0A066VU67_TILAU|nr:uncharacterized protein K437DRAFT_256719 [Tilletiaria anomala UBC 951]KDN45267.1 hypothetical protein K437DRAFT_256719 [Tilletiaria anomala UBC 951]
MANGAPPLVLPQVPVLPVLAPVWDIALYAAVSLGMVLWDYLLTLPNEIRWYRKKGFVLITLPFVIVRYVPIIWLVLFLTGQRAFWTEKTCNVVGRIVPYACCIVTLGASAIFVFRTWAIYNRNRTILCLLCFLWVGQAVCTLVVTSYTIPLIGPGGLGCFPLAKPHPNVYYAYFIANVIFDVAIVLISSLRLLKGMKASPNQRTAGMWRQRLLADGLLYFVAVLVVNVLNAAFFAANPMWAYAYINAALNVAVTGISASRLVLLSGSNSGGALGTLGAFALSGRGESGSGSGSGGGSGGRKQSSTTGSSAGVTSVDVMSYNGPPVSGYSQTGRTTNATYLGSPMSGFSFEPTKGDEHSATHPFTNGVFPIQQTHARPLASDDARPQSNCSINQIHVIQKVEVEREGSMNVS